MVEIIRAKPGHLEDVYRLICELEGKDMDADAFACVYASNLTDPNICYMVAVQDGQAVGFASLHVQALLHHGGKIGELQEIVVKQGTQGRGIGASLLRKIKQESIDRGCSQLEVCCNNHRTRSHGFYENQGMRNTHLKFTLKLP